MKILHTSDWHLGKWLDNFSRLEEQRAVMSELCSIANEHNVDTVLVAGDVFDTYNPPIEAVELLYSTLKKLSNNGKRPVVVIAGNHDSPERIESPDSLARMNGIVFMGFPNTHIAPFEIDGGFKVTRSDAGFVEFQLPSGELLRVLSGAFANELRLKICLDDEKEGDILQRFWTQLAEKYCDEKGINVLLGHLLMFGDDRPLVSEQDDERSIEHISARINQQSIPPQIHYTALGHLHRYQKVASSTQQTIVYSGSPLAYSFSESGQHKYALIIDAECNKPLVVNPITLHSGRLLIRKTCNSIDEALQWLPLHNNALIELTIRTEQFLDASVIRSLRELNNGIVSIIPLVINDSIVLTEDNEAVQKNKSIQELFVEYFEHSTKQKPTSAILKLFDEVLHQKV